MVKTNEPEDVEKLTELYIKLEQIQAYIRKIAGRINKYSTDLESLRKKRLEKEGEMIRGLQTKSSVVSDRTI